MVADEVADEACSAIKLAGGGKEGGLGPGKGGGGGVGSGCSDLGGNLGRSGICTHTFAFAFGPLGLVFAMGCGNASSWLHDNAIASTSSGRGRFLLAHGRGGDGALATASDEVAADELPQW